MRDIILDFETLDTKDTAIVPSIGARLCNLETGEMGETFHVKLDVQEQIDAGYTFSASTLAFWMKQQAAGRDYLIEILDKKTVTVSRKQAFDMLYRFIRGVKDAFVWGNGATFDLGICIREYGDNNLPWQFWAEQDVRSIVSFCKRVFGVEFKKETPFEGVQHQPVDDATHEASYLMRYFEYARNTAHTKLLVEDKLNDAEFEISQLKEQLKQALARIEELENPPKIIDCSGGNVPGGLDDAIAGTYPAEDAPAKLDGIAFIGNGPTCIKDKDNPHMMFSYRLNLELQPHTRQAEVVICFGAETYEGGTGQVVVKVDRTLPVTATDGEREIYNMWQKFMQEYTA